MGKRQGTGRGRPSSIDQLPEDVRLKLNADLRDRRLTQADIVAGINQELTERGERPISKSAVNRYSLAIEQKGSMMREAREAADALVGGLGEQKGTDLGRAVTELVKTLTFDLVVNGQEDEDGKPTALGVDTLNKVALIAQRIERASKISLEREAEVRRQVLEDAAKSVKATAKAAGVSGETIDAIMEKMSQEQA